MTSCDPAIYPCFLTPIMTHIFTGAGSYFAHPENPDWTVSEQRQATFRFPCSRSYSDRDWLCSQGFEQKATLSVSMGGYIDVAMESFLISAYSAGIDKGRVVDEEIVADTRDRALLLDMRPWAVQHPALALAANGRCHCPPAFCD